jgi:hypothetical protein
MLASEPLYETRAVSENHTLSTNGDSEEQGVTLATTTDSVWWVPSTLNKHTFGLAVNSGLLRGAATTRREELLLSGRPERHRAQAIIEARILLSMYYDCNVSCVSFRRKFSRPLHDAI